MKNAFILLFLQILVLPCFCQSLILSGRILHARKEEVELNIPFDNEYCKDNSIYKQLGENGVFHYSLPGVQPRFVRLLYKGNEQWLLLSPRMPLQIDLDARHPLTSLHYSGKGGPASELWRQVTPVLPPFSTVSLGENILQAVWVRHQLDSVMEKVGKARLSEPVTTALATEWRYSFARMLIDPFKSRISVDTLLPLIPLPTEKEMELSPSACAYLKNYLVARFVQQCIVYKKDSVAGKALIEQTIGIPFDTLQKWGGYGDDYLITLYARKLLPPQVQEKYMAGRLLYYCQEKYFETAQKLYEDYAGYFPNGSHAILCRQRFEGLKKLLEQSRQNSEIVFRPHAENTASLEELIAPYKGKVVYLDIWGTWCGPCREEMGFAPALKEHFAGREIVFLYLDMDEATQDAKWKNYVSIEKVTGHHLRMDGQRMEKIWEALLHTVNVPRYYPSYFIFDRDGKLIAGKARRPSEKEELYKQLEEIVNK